MWPDLFKRSKAAGIDVIQTYVFWDLHNPVENGPLNFQGNANLMKFLQLAKEHDLWVNLRIGPYVCAEVEIFGLFKCDDMIY
jgi:beta-galactosidase GanA